MKIAADYAQFGTFLLDDRSGIIVKTLAHKHHYDTEEINKEILKEWLTGRGKQPVTWATLVNVLRDIKLSSLADDIEAAKRPGYFLSVTYLHCSCSKLLCLLVVKLAEGCNNIT